MEYFRTPKNQIYADQAFRLGKIISQYKRMSFQEEKFEATLCLAVLQNLMTNSNEYVRQMTKGTRRNSIFNKDISDSIWGIDDKCWIKHTFNEKLTLQNFITRIRNSVSHPTNVDFKSDFPSTGYSTIKDDSGIIQKFRFINSPDTTQNRPKIFPNLKSIERVIYQRDNIEEKVINGEFPSNITYCINQQGKYGIVLDEKPFARISIIDITVEQLFDFVTHLANYLAQPIQENWDGETIKNLIAA